MEKVRIAFVTYDGKPDMTGDDKHLLEELARKNIQAHSVSWRSKVNWKQFDAVVIRSCWDYHLFPDEFLNWLDEIDKDAVPVFNPTDLVRWNLHKGYLRDLASRNVCIPATRFLEKGSSVDLARLMSEMNWRRAVVKPCISASSYKTWVTDRNSVSLDNKNLNHMLSKQDFMVQEFVGEVCTRGELSMIFFDKKYSHGVLKVPQYGEFRVQEAFGGTASAYVPPPDIVNSATQIVSSVEADLLYARVDGVERNGMFCLMELELIEPVLFFGQSQQSSLKFCESLDRFIRNPSCVY